MGIDFKAKTLLALSSAMALVPAMPAFAQGDEPRASSSSDIIVTARRSEERLQDVPISITVFNQDQISNRAITNTNDLATYTPSLGQSNVLGNLQATFSLRGFNQELSTSATVGVFFADVVAPRGASNQQQVGDGAGPGSFFDLENVQVLKGPQGTLFGRNTTGGAILIVPKKPVDKFEGYVEGSYGNYDMYRAQAVLNVPLGEMARFRIGIDRQKRDGYVKNLSAIGPRAFNDTDYWAARASLVVDLTPDLENYTIATFTHSKTAGEANNLYQSQISTASPLNALFSNFGWLAQRELQLRPANAGFFVTENALKDPRTELTEWRVIITTTWHAADNLTIKNITSYAQMSYDLQNPVLGVALPLDQMNADGSALIPIISNPLAVGPLAGGVNAILSGLNLPAGTPWTIAGAYSLFLAAAGRLNPANVRPGLTFPTGTTLPFTNSNPNFVGHTADQWTFVEELQFQGQALENKLNWQAGFYFEKSGPLGNSGSATANVATQPDPNNPFSLQNFYYGFGSVGYNDVRKTITSVGTYAQLSYELSDKLKLTGGLRYTWDKQDATGALRTYAPLPYNPDNLMATYSIDPATGFICTIVAPGVTAANRCVQNNSQSSKAPTWLLGVDFKPNSDMLLYAKYARGYRTGGVNLQLPVEFQRYGPEKVDSYEVGLKTSIRAVRGTFNVAGFYNDFSNQQVPVGLQPLDPRFSNQTGVINAGKSRIWGVEVEAGVEPFRGFVLSAGYSYLNTKIKQIVIPSFNNGVYKTDGTLSPRAGDRLSFSPDHKLTATAAYTLPLGEGAGDLTFSTTYTYTGDRVSTYRQRDANGKLTGYSMLKPYELLDFNINWKRIGGSPVDAAAFMTNALQEKYFTYILDVGQSFQMAQLGQARMYGLRLKYNFGE